MVKIIKETVNYSLENKAKVNGINIKPRKRKKEAINKWISQYTKNNSEMKKKKKTEKTFKSKTEKQLMKNENKKKTPKNLN